MLLREAHRHESVNQLLQVRPVIDSTHLKAARGGEKSVLLGGGEGEGGSPGRSTQLIEDVVRALPLLLAHLPGHDHMVPRAGEHEGHVAAQGWCGFYPRLFPTSRLFSSK